MLEIARRLGRIHKAQEDERKFGEILARQDFVLAELQNAEDLKGDQNFDQSLHVGRIGKRIEELRLGAIGFRGGRIPAYDNIIWVTTDRFYNLNTGSLYRAPEQLVMGDTITGGNFTFFPYLNQLENVFPEEWVLDRKIVSKLSDQLVRLASPSLAAKAFDPQSQS